MSLPSPAPILELNTPLDYEYWSKIESWSLKESAWLLTDLSSTNIGEWDGSAFRHSDGTYWNKTTLNGFFTNGHNGTFNLGAFSPSLPKKLLQYNSILSRLLRAESSNIIQPITPKQDAYSDNYYSPLEILKWATECKIDIPTKLQQDVENHHGIKQDCYRTNIILHEKLKKLSEETAELKNLIEQHRKTEQDRYDENDSLKQHVENLLEAAAELENLKSKWLTAIRIQSRKFIKKFWKLLCALLLGAGLFLHILDEYNSYRELLISLFDNVLGPLFRK